MIDAIITSITDIIINIFPLDCLTPMFMRRAMLGILLIAPFAAFSGIHIVNSQMSFFSDAIGHSAFAGVALGLIFSFPIDVSMPVVALIVGILVMELRQKTKLSTDTVIGIIFSAIVAFGLAVVSKNRAAARNINMFLYGDILTIGNFEIVYLFILLIILFIFQIFSWNRMLHIAINEQIATVHRIPIRVYQFIFTCLLSLVVIVCVRAVGVLLVTAILIVPAAIARNIARNSSQLFYVTLVASYISCVAGLIISAQDWAQIPAGASIVLTACLLFAISHVFRHK